jgi:DNA excision repair protein ERCC-3
LGRILRPKANGQKAYFYQLVTQDTVDQEYAWQRQTFLREKGYHYFVVKWGGT